MFQKHSDSKPIWWLFWAQEEFLPDFWYTNAALEMLFRDKQKFPRQGTEILVYFGIFWAKLVRSVQVNCCMTYWMDSGPRIKRYVFCSLLLTPRTLCILSSYPHKARAPPPHLQDQLVTDPEISLDKEVFLCESQHKMCCSEVDSSMQKSWHCTSHDSSNLYRQMCSPEPLTLHPAVSWSHLLARWEKSWCGQSG